MKTQLIKNDIIKHKLVTVAMTGFIGIAAMLVSLATILTIHLVGSLDTLMNQSKTPDFMQMHSGHLDMGELNEFVNQNKDIENFQVLNFLNLDNYEISFEGISMKESAQDHGISTQSKDFDYLLDLDGEIIQPRVGELYVPICYLRDNTTKIGDKALIYGQELIVSGFLRDSQMNSSLSSSKRFLVNVEDYEKIAPHGNIEYLIEFQLKDHTSIGAFESAYISAGLPANGPMVTYELFKTLNAFSDGLMIAVIFLMSLLLVSIAFMCIRFTLLSKIEEDYREIGMMKAIGLRVSDIQRIYLSKYALIGVVGCVVGYGFSLLFQETLSENIRLFMGESELAYLAPILGILGVILIFLATLLYVQVLLLRFKKISPAQAIRFGTMVEKTKKTNHLHLSNRRMMNTNAFLGIKDIWTRKKLYMTMFLVIMIASFMMIVPLNIYHTISSKNFTTYMGIGNSDMRIDIQQIENIEGKTDEIADDLKNNESISKLSVLTTKSFKSEDNTTLKVELGDHSIFPITYEQGKFPSTESEIALSVMNGDELSKGLYDKITLIVDGNAKEFVICGIYSDITNGGKTAKAYFHDDSASTMWSVINVEIKDKNQVGAIVEQTQSTYTFAKVSDIDDYIGQTFGQTIRSMKTVSRVAIATAILIVLLVSVLFIKMLIAKDKYSIAILKAFGFTSNDIMVQYVVRFVSVCILAIFVGTLLANTLGEAMASMIISSFGAASFEFMIHPLSAYVLCPIILICSVLIAMIIGTSSVRSINISENIKE